MGQEAKLKDMRKQLRNVVKEYLTDTWHHETVSKAFKEVTDAMNKRLDTISENMTTAIKNIDDRSKDVQSYIIRNTTHVPAPVEIPANTPVAITEET
jgi:uncharacterized coiled-coil DUF342 family protein